ncbi:MAG TPA: efflux RND transporter permease subunit, partial [Burkholderiaceae bacterium]|nr:efflux RND transporter permease subunit [Burkholderiaceae bacterium]
MSRFNISKWALDHAALTRYLLVVLLVLGAAAYFQLGQDEDPPFTFRAMALRVFWPGATAQQVAEQVIDKLEKTLQEVPHADKIRSYSKPGEALIIFQVRDSSPPKEMAQIWYTVRKKIGDMRATLPAGVIGPYFNDEFGDVYGSIYALSADGFSYQELKDQADRVRQRLLKVQDVSKVGIFGAQDEKLFVEIPQRRLAELGLDFNQVLAQLGQQNAVESAGVVNAPTDFVQVRVGGQFNTVDELRQFPIRANGASFKLGDIASVRRGYVDPPQVKVRHQGAEVIALGISMARGGDIVRMGKALDATVAQIRAELPAGIELHQFQNQSKVVTSSVNEFVGTLIEAVVIVLGVSFVALGLHFKPFRLDWRPGLVVGITIPLVL